VLQTRILHASNLSTLRLVPATGSGYSSKQHCGGNLVAAPPPGFTPRLSLPLACGLPVPFGMPMSSSIDSTIKCDAGTSPVGHSHCTTQLEKAMSCMDGTFSCQRMPFGMPMSSSIDSTIKCDAGTSPVAHSHCTTQFEKAMSCMDGTFSFQRIPMIVSFCHVACGGVERVAHFLAWAVACRFRRSQLPSLPQGAAL